MRLTNPILALVFSVGFVASSASLAQVAPTNPDSKTAAKAEHKPTQKPQTLCPIQKGPIDKNVFTDYKGKRIYFCCPGCVETFKKDPDKYIKQMEKEGIILDQTPQK